MKDIIARRSRGHNSDFVFITRDAVLSFIALSGYLYYCYKFGSPDLGNNDFYRYREMVEHPFDVNAAPAPFVLRQLPTAVAHLFYELGVFYDTKTNFDNIILPEDVTSKRVFFALILSNTLAAGISFVISLHFIRKKLADDSTVICFAYVGIMLSYFYFPFSIIAPLATGWGWLTSAILTVALLGKKPLLVFAGSVLALLTRETILIFTLVFSLLAWASFGQRDRFFLRSAFVFAMAGAGLVFVRTYLVHGYDHQVDFSIVVNNILFFSVFSREYLFQALLPQALIFVLLLLLYVENHSYVWVLFFSMVAVMLVGIATGVGPGIGRAVGETLPFYATIFLLLKMQDVNAGRGMKSAE